MFAVLVRTWALMLGILLLMIGNGLQGTLLGVRGSIEQIDPAWMGFIMSAYFVGFLGGSKVTPVLLRRVGHVRVFAAFGSLVSAAFILYAAFVNPIFWFFMRLIVGFCFSGLYVVAESWINDQATNETRGQSLSLYIVVQMTGVVAGQVLLNVADPSGYGLFILISVLVSISFAPILLSISPTPVYDASRPMSLKELMRASPLGCVGVFMLGGIFSALFGMASVFATERGLSVREISWFVTSIYVGGLLLQYPIGWISDRMDRRSLIIIMTGLLAGSAVLGAAIGESIVLLLIISFAIGATANPLYALLIAHTNDHLETDQMASASGGLVFINGCGAMGGPILVGYLINNIGPNGFFYFVAILAATICFYSLYRTTRREAVSVEEIHPYVPISATSSTVVAELAAEVAIEEHDEQVEERLAKPPFD